MTNVKEKDLQVIELPIVGTGLSLHVAVGKTQTTITYDNSLQITPEQYQAFVFLLMNVDPSSLNYTMAGMLSAYATDNSPICECDWIDISNIQQFAQMVSYGS